MCGRAFETYTPEELNAMYLKDSKWFAPINHTLPDFSPNYNLCPTQFSPILCFSDQQIGFKLMRWGLVPSWAKSVKDADKYSMFNAKSEEIAEKRSYKAAYKSRRCIVPLTGFYEWKRESAEKIPYAITLNDNKIMSLAGIWEHWQAENETLDSFTIITTSANTFMQDIHTRMPVILSSDSENIWMNPDSDVQELQSIMKPCSSDILKSWQVSRLVNSVKNNSVENLRVV